jgi:hypothetical protein
MQSITYLIYIIFWESLVFGGTFYACVIKVVSEINTKLGSDR